MCKVSWRDACAGPQKSVCGEEFPRAMCVSKNAQPFSVAFSLSRPSQLKSHINEINKCSQTNARTTRAPANADIEHAHKIAIDKRNGVVFSQTEAEMYLFLGRDVVRSIFFLIFFSTKDKGRGKGQATRAQLKSAIVGLHLETYRDKSPNFTRF